jgi:hypothetical protein
MTEKFFKNIVLLSCLFFLTNIAKSQQITYSEVDREEGRINAYEVIGKLNGNILIYKNIRDVHYIQTFNNEMVPIEKTKLEYLSDRVFNVDFLLYKDFVYLFYQFQKKNIVYCNAVKLDGFGKKTGEILELDTTDARGTVNNKMYEFLFSEDKQKIAFIKVNSKEEKQHFVTTVLFDKDLQLIEKKRFAVPMPDRSDYLTEFVLSNKGDISFLRAWGSQNDNISKITLFTKEQANSNLQIQEVLSPKTAYLDDIKVKVDNLNNTFILTSFYAKKRRGDIEGIYTITIDKDGKFVSKNTVFNEDFRFNAKGDQSSKTAFNEYYIKHIISKKDGGYIITAQCEYTSTRGGNSFNRWDNFGSPWGMNSFDYYNFGGGGMFFASPWNRWGNNNSITRYFSDNIAVMSFDANGNMQWSNVLYKSQFDDNTDQNLGFGLFNTGNQLHFLFNKSEKRQVFLTDNSITPDGQIIRNSTLKNLDKGYDFLPRFAKQTGAKQIIVPCLYRNYISFAKIEY